MRTASSCDSVCVGLVIGLVLVVVIVVVVVVVVVVVRKRRRRSPAAHSVGPHVSNIVISPPAERGQYEYINPTPVNDAESLPSNNIPLSEKNGPKPLESQYLTILGT